MKKLMVALSLAALTFGAAAETYTWTGGETTSGNWNNSGSWSAAGGMAGVPGGGDTAVINDEVTFTSDIAIAGGTLRITSSKAVTISGVISGAGALDVNASTELTLSGANTYAGGTTARGKVRLSNATAFGSNRTVLHANGTLRFAAAGATYAYDITPTGCDNYYYNIEASGTLDGSIASTRVDYFNTTIHTESTGSGAIFEITGRVAVKDGTHGSLTLRPRTTGKIRILGGVNVKKVDGDATGDGWSYGWRELGGECSIGAIDLAYVNGFLCLSPTVLSSATLLNFTGYTDGDKACVDLNGFDQTANRLVTEAPASYNTKAWRIDSPTDAATLTLAPSQDALTNYAYVMGKVSLVLDAPAAETVQVFQGRASTTTGDLTVRSGVLRIADGATFPNVTKVTVEENGTLDLRTAAFSTKAVALSLETGATVCLAKDVELMVASLTVGGEVQRSGTYPFGDGRIVVPTPVSPTSTGVWTGAGATESSLDLANWEGGYPGQIPVTFATGGVRAKLAEDLLTASVTFQLPDATEAFTVASDESAPDAALHVAGNVTMAAGAVPHTATVSAPLSLDAAAVDLAVAGKNDTLVLNGPFVQGSSTLKLRKTGTGTLYLNATNSTITSGSVELRGGISYVKGGSLGGTPANPIEVAVSQADAANVFHLCGGVFNQAFTCSYTSGNTLTADVAEGTTNVLNGCLTYRSNYGGVFVLRKNSLTDMNGGYYSSWANEYRPTIDFYEDSTLYLTNKPYLAGMQCSDPGFIKSRSAGLPSERQNVYLGAKGSCAKNGLVLVGPMKVTFTADNVFTGAEGGFDTPLRLMRINNADEYLKPVILDLNGHSQRFGSLATRPSSQAEYGYLGCWGDSANSYFTSATPATLDVYQNGTQNDTPWNSTFRGAVSLVKHGEKTLTLGGVSSSSGRLEVAEGRLDFTDNGAWTNVSVVAVSGGTLAVDTSARLKRRADYYLSGGKLDIAAGVRLVAENLYVPDGEGGWTKAEPGTYTAADLPAYVSGEGALRVRGGGYSVIIR